jgi:hypothetical protein
MPCWDHIGLSLGNTLLPLLQVLLVPITESLIGSRDRESNLLYSDLVVSEEFLGSHTLRIPIANGATGNAKDDSSVRDSRGKAKQVTTVNGRTVIVKESSVYSNKGRKASFRSAFVSCAEPHFQASNP